MNGPLKVTPTATGTIPDGPAMTVDSIFGINTMLHSIWCILNFHPSWKHNNSFSPLLFCAAESLPWPMRYVLDMLRHERVCRPFRELVLIVTGLIVDTAPADDANPIPTSTVDTMRSYVHEFKSSMFNIRQATRELSAQVKLDKASHRDLTSFYTLCGSLDAVCTYAETIETVSSIHKPATQQ